MQNELVVPKVVELLDICGADRESGDPRFLACTGVGLFPAGFAGLGKMSCGWRGVLLLGRLQPGLLLSTKQGCFLGVWQPAPVKKNWSWLPKRVSGALKWNQK